MVIKLPPWVIWGTHNFAKEANEWHDTSMAREKPAEDVSTTFACKSSKGAHAMEWITKSSCPKWPTAASTNSGSACGFSTSQLTRCMPNGFVNGST
jgi:hypothetical protein